MKEDGRERRGRAEEGMERTEEEKEEVREGVRTSFAPGRKRKVGACAERR